MDARQAAGHGARHRVALVGLGWVGRELWFPLLRDHADFEVVAAVDPNPASRAAFAKATGIPVHSAVHRLTARSVDLAVVAVPHHLHAEVAGALLATGISVFLEKPVCLTSSEADVLAAAERSGGMLLAGNAAHHRADVRVLRRVLAELGDIRHIDLGTTAVRGAPQAAGGTLGWHLLDTLASLLGPERFEQVVGVTTEARDVSRIRVEGSRGSAELRCMPDPIQKPVLTVTRAGTTMRVPVPAEPVGAEHRRQLDDLAAMLADQGNRGRAIAQARPIVRAVESTVEPAQLVREAVPAYQ